MNYIWKRVSNGILEQVNAIVGSETVEQVEINSKAANAYMAGIFDVINAVYTVEGDDAEIYTAFVRMINDVAANHKFVIENSHEYGID